MMIVLPNRPWVIWDHAYGYQNCFDLAAFQPRFKRRAVFNADTYATVGLGKSLLANSFLHDYLALANRPTVALYLDKWSWVSGSVDGAGNINWGRVPKKATGEPEYYMPPPDLPELPSDDSEQYRLPHEQPDRDPEWEDPPDLDFDPDDPKWQDFGPGN